MSDEKPFAVVQFDGERLTVGDSVVECCSKPAATAMAINESVASRERKAAARALREAADADDSDVIETDGVAVLTETVRAWLRSRADEVERGEQ